MTQKSIELELQDTIALIQAFKRLIEMETLALDKANFGEVDKLQERKRELAKSYQMQVENLHSRAAEIKKTSESLRAQLVEARTAFTLALTDNMAALERVKNSCGRLVDRILDSARRALQQQMPNAPQSYGATGRQVYSARKTLSMSLNEQL